MSINAQTPVDAADVASYSTAAQGEVYVDGNNIYYLGVQDGSLVLLSGNSGSTGQINTQMINIAGGGSAIFAAPSNGYLSAWVLALEVPVEFVPTGTIDPGNVSTQDDQLINNNYSDLVYNTSSSGSSNKALPAIDLGVSQDIGEVRVHWWRDDYVCTNYNIQGSNNGSTWTDLVTGINAQNVIANEN